jgi:hypothetical protein
MGARFLVGLEIGRSCASGLESEEGDTHCKCTVKWIQSFKRDKQQAKIFIFSSSIPFYLFIY